MKELEVLKTILYFSIFKHPLSKKEVFKFTNAQNQIEVNQEIDILTQKGIIYKIDEFYCAIDDSSLVKRRLDGNRMAKKIMPKAFKVGRFISKFPYIESVSISGALSKGYYDSEGDIDFFIITKSKRLWIARTLLILYKKVFLLNSKKFFCVNYFIAEDSLKITEQNRFTATEMTTLIPVSGKDIFTEFMNKNIWVRQILPNSISLKIDSIKDINKPWITKLLETFFNGSFGDYFESIFRKVTLKKWNSKFRHLEKNDFEIAMKSTEGVSKHHPQNFQKKVIEKLNEDYEKIKQEHNIQLLLEHA